MLIDEYDKPLLGVLLTQKRSMVKIILLFWLMAVPVIYTGNGQYPFPVRGVRRVRAGGRCRSNRDWFSS